TRRNAFGDVGGGGAFGHVLDAAIGKSDVDGIHYVFVQSLSRLAYRRRKTGSRRDKREGIGKRSCRSTRPANVPPGGERGLWGRFVRETSRRWPYNLRSTFSLASGSSL